MTRRQRIVAAATPGRSAVVLFVALALSLLAGGAEAAADEDWRQDGAGFEGVEDPARAHFELPQPFLELALRGEDAEDLLDVVITLTHDVPIGEGRTLRVNEHFTLRSWLRWPRRAVLFLVSSFARGDYWSIPVPGYNGTEMAAQRGMFAYTFDYIGTGDSYRPGDGLESTFEANLEALKIVVRYIRFHRAVPQIDLVGESWGGVHAIYLAADEARIRSCVLSTMSYKSSARPDFQEGEFVEYLQSLPNNYFPMAPELYESFSAEAPEAVKEYARSTQPGLYLTTHLWQGIRDGFPHFDPSVARVPGLVISGAGDRPEDGQALATDYDIEGALFLVIEGAGHGPRVEKPESAERFWNAVFDFIDPG